MVEHYPVLHREVLSFFKNIKGRYIVDATVGGGGHSFLLLKNLPETFLIGIDKDDYALEKAEEKLSPFKGRFRLIKGSFKDIDTIVHSMDIKYVSGVLFDLGVSTFQLKTERGFSFQREEPLDMRMDRTQKKTAFDVVNRYTKIELEKIIKDYGEEKFARRIASAIVEARKKKRIETTKELAQIVYNVYPPPLRRGRIHPATKTFQAIRIEVNNELEEIKEGVNKGIDLLEKGGIIAVISFHSLEDRIVKNIYRERKRLKDIEILTKKPITPGTEEIRENPPSRSAKLRVAKRI
ncbi:MAG TPA: 16S rRNA (cytosine(1402)-N(4))-methyltransferase RsmH [Persephonella sp.]|uniref:Ribosomal RNA small subunit methyltransferase H n=1 Tax=Persephonella marina (strain DSM 14350 / EX-H1) TaxID=123214 RepID=RSMH_PERMH|nr:MULTISPECIES: 16S rRNA (cytosine(1402)-N(4))-methyltransferase RsmH [Persephonella]C0QP68.1 RecName: Full=Ribosomal RNA small subunit methyltransferase H; AltName: Full=16S rRNA m(4)C1402 methyltransferase; AltName: Full=rRNA (cytosine-N(4)-)-methyltransferase RsmH [Persephonella marina EX-H1]ACO04814.1 S-adenosyl-methyltransferase MraW [Persephonella marina EX-H1]HCB69920.1 16S rRNA (cytosine(1402)-N(4))-methyltransferase RsmH [Persephonella sp.]